jgi:hypothetical protein
MSRADDNHSNSAANSVSPTVCGVASVAVQLIRFPEIQSMHRPLLLPACDSCSPRPLASRTAALLIQARSPTRNLSVVGHATLPRGGAEGDWASPGCCGTPRRSQAHVAPEGAAGSITASTACMGGTDKQAWEATKQPRDARPAPWLERSRLLPISHGRFEARPVLLPLRGGELRADRQLTFYFRIFDGRGYAIQRI